MFYTLFTLLPKFMHEVLHYDFITAGFLESLPFLLLATCLVFTGFASDWARHNTQCSLTNIRKLSICPRAPPLAYLSSSSPSPSTMRHAQLMRLHAAAVRIL